MGVVAVVSWEITPALTVRVHHLQLPAVMEVQILQIYQMENVVMKVRNILPQNMNEEVIGKNAIMITKAMISMMKQMVHLTKKAREFLKVQVLLKKKGHLVVNPLLIIQPMTILKQTNRNRHKQKKEKKT